MLLSIFNFKGWRKALIMGIGLSMIFLSGLEYLYRSLGYTPTVSDTKELWINERNKVYKKNGKVLVLLGASRIQVGIDKKTLLNYLPDYRIIQLAVSDSDCIPALIDLANDSDFKGIIICSVSENLTLKYNTNEGTQAQYIHEYHSLKNWNWTKPLDFFVSNWLQNNATLLSPSLSLKQLIRHRHLPDIYHIRTFSDRFQKADYRKTQNIDIAEQNNIQANREFYKRNANNPSYKPEAFISSAHQINPYIQKLKDRGCTVVFLRFPTSGYYWTDFEDFFPKRKYWDAISNVSKAHMIHFKDYPTLDAFECPEGNHLDMRDTVPFTKALIDILIKEKILPSRES